MKRIALAVAVLSVSLSALADNSVGGYANFTGQSTSLASSGLYGAGSSTFNTSNTTTGSVSFAVRPVESGFSASQSLNTTSIVNTFGGTTGNAPGMSGTAILNGAGSFGGSTVNTVFNNGFSGFGRE